MVYFFLFAFFVSVNTIIRQMTEHLMKRETNLSYVSILAGGTYVEVSTGYHSAGEDFRMLHAVHLRQPVPRWPIGILQRSNKYLKKNTPFLAR